MQHVAMIVGVSGVAMLAACAAPRSHAAISDAGLRSSCYPSSTPAIPSPLQASGAAAPTRARSGKSSPTPLALDARYDRAVLTAADCDHPGTVVIFDVRVAGASRTPDGGIPSHGEYEKASITIRAVLGPATYNARDFDFIGVDSHRYVATQIGTPADSSEPQLTSGTIPAGESTYGVLYFDVPPGGGKLELRQSATATPEVWDIGP